MNSSLAGLDEEKFEKVCDQMARRHGVVRRRDGDSFRTEPSLRATSLFTRSIAK